jgi:heme/copper-type cytochrome/quinol oxidase subunit 2
MKKIIIFLIIFFFSLPLLGVGENNNGLPDVPIIKVLVRISDILFYVLLIVATIFIIVSGFFFVTARGDPEQINKAKTGVLYAIIGVVVAIAAKGAVSFIVKILFSS